MISAVLFDPDGTLVETEELKAISHGPSVAELRPDVPEEGAAAAYAGDLVGRSRYQVEHILSVLGLEDAFDMVATADDISRGEPDPEIDLLVAKKMGLPPEEFLVIEDSPAVVGAVVAAGMVVVAVPTRLTVRGVRAAGLQEPRWVVEGPQTLPDVVRQRIEEAGGRRKGDR